jgi:hypothetical protein
MPPTVPPIYTHVMSIGGTKALLTQQLFSAIP